LRTGAHRLLDDPYGANTPCDPRSLCEQIIAAQVANPARILDVAANLQNYLRHNELFGAVFEESQLSADISADIINNSVIYVKVYIIVYHTSDNSIIKVRNTREFRDFVGN
jgi:hypothetical protein